jgi:hypothetical protein
VQRSSSHTNNPTTGVPYWHSIPKRLHFTAKNKNRNRNSAKYVTIEIVQKSTISRQGNENPSWNSLVESHTNSNNNHNENTDSNITTANNNNVTDVDAGLPPIAIALLFVFIWLIKRCRQRSKSKDIMGDYDDVRKRTFVIALVMYCVALVNSPLESH